MLTSEAGRGQNKEGKMVFSTQHYIHYLSMGMVSWYLVGSPLTKTPTLVEMYTCQEPIG